MTDRERIAELERQNQRLTDLVRYARHHLFTEELISPDEYAALVSDSENGQRVARLEDYDGMRMKMASLERQLAEAREDTARLNRLEALIVDVLRETGPTRANRVFYRHPAAHGSLRSYIDDSLIDAARGAK